MAIWQYDLIIRSKNKKCWTIEEVETEILKLKEQLPETKSWSNRMRVFGKEDSTCILVFTNNNYVDEIEVRIDLRSLTKHSFSLIIGFIETIDSLILTDNGEMIEFNEQWIIKEIQDSNALKVVKNPVKYFDNLK